MMGLGEYFMSVIAASVITALIGILFGDDRSGIPKTVNTVCSLFLLCVIVLPISSLIADAKDKINAEEIADAYESAISAEEALYSSVGEISGEMIEEVLLDHITERLDIEKDNIEVRAEVGILDGEVILEHIVICLHSGAKWSDPREIEDAVRALTDAECLIINGE